MVHLASQHADIRAAAAAALAAAMAVHPASVTPGCEACMDLYAEPLEPTEDGEEEQQQTVNGKPGRGSFDLGGGLQKLGNWVEEDEASLMVKAEAAAVVFARRCGSALGLRAVAPLLSAWDVSQALHFLISKGLADEDDTVRELMVAAGEGNAGETAEWGVKLAGDSWSYAHIVCTLNGDGKDSQNEVDFPFGLAITSFMGCRDVAALTH